MSKEFRFLVRLHGTTLDGTKPVPHALRGIKGVGIRLAHAVVRKSDISPSLRLGGLSDAELRRLDEILTDPASRGLPAWMLNRRRDPQTGGDHHLTGSDLDLRVKEDLDLMKEVRSWKGERHARGLKVRGQRTKTSARKGRSIGVAKKQEQMREEQK